MNKEFVTYNQSLALKELGFDEKCLAYWFNETPLNPEGQCLVYYRKPYDNVGITNGIIREYGWAPLYQQAFRWFRDKHSFIGISTISNYSDDRYVFDIFQKGNEEIYFEGSDLSDRNNGNKEYNTYEEAESACLDKLIEILKAKKT